ncbi:MAG: putative bifunctional diguanylate cyclase/phosphodiesterase [Betaproteobacteria bacterium]
MALFRSVLSRISAVAGSFENTLWRPLVACRLCRSVAFSVFILILLIESLILIPSTLGFYRDERRRIEEKVITAAVTALSIESGAMRSADVQRRMLAVVRDPQIVGLRIVDRYGSTLAQVGTADFQDFNTDAVWQGRHRLVRRHLLRSEHYDIAFRQVINDMPLVVVARTDGSSLHAAVLAFVLRIAGLVALIVAVVTTGTMFVLHRSVLGPVLRLRASMLAAAASPSRPDDFQISERPQDELGDVFEAHNQMLSRVAESHRADRTRAEERARFLSRHDALTGLPNREFFLEHLRETLAVACERGESVHVLALNLAEFRGVNDALGQDIGDSALAEVGRRLSTLIKSGQFAARLGGDEFGITSLGASNPSRLAEHAERVQAEVERPLRVGGHELRLRCKIGIACPDSGCVDAATILHDAEVALSRIRRDARIPYQFFSPHMTQEARRRQQIERELREALEGNSLQLFYQPKVSLCSDGTVLSFTSCEALIRWQHPVRGWIAPGEFIPVAESTGLILPVGTSALRQACIQIRQWRDAGLKPPRVAVNVSAEQFRDPALPHSVRTALTAANVSPEMLELEITESAVMNDVELTTEVLTTLRRLGVHLSIDDFGTGYSSLSYLRRFDIDALKIDKSFVDDLGRDANADAICDAIIQLGHSLGKRVVAEGVESLTQRDFLRLRHCDEAQGFLFARPMPPSELARLLRQAGELDGRAGSATDKDISTAAYRASNAAAGSA